MIIVTFVIITLVIILCVCRGSAIMNSICYANQPMLIIMYIKGVNQTFAAKITFYLDKQCSLHQVNEYKNK